ncbi:hypothetical protein J5U21_02031 [Saccharolobus shibatae]|uniref:Uncharacterized protein n=1 Tax=Saccharolobus shibatae TaxID=2286 RepID=A0A8F5BVY9_9CREN|nr:hypothetical protein J5U21_02031 [Saccharolobus shibatae]
MKQGTPSNKGIEARTLTSLLVAVVLIFLGNTKFPALPIKFLV